MKKIHLLLSTLLIVITSFAQQQNKPTFLIIHAGYGTETNIGFPGAFAGAGLQHKWGNLQLEAKATYFNDNDNDQLYTNAKEDYKAFFLTPSIGWNVIGTDRTFFRTIIMVGPALKWYKAKEVSNIYMRMSPDGRRTVVEPVTYYIEKEVNVSLYSALDFSFTLSPKLQLALFLDTYSHEILLEHFMPGLKVGVRL
jgi:hypothetical protein